MAPPVSCCACDKVVSYHSEGPQQKKQGASGRGTVMTMRRQERAAEFWALLQAVPYALVVTDSDRRVVFVNSRAESMSGYAREEVLHQLVELFVPDRHQAAFAAYWDSC